MERSGRILATAGTAVAAVVAVLVSGGGAAPALTAPRPAALAASAGRSPSAGAFDPPVSNPWFPLRRGFTTVLRGTDEGRHFRERVRVTHRTRVIQGVTTHVVRDMLRR